MTTHSGMSSLVYFEGNWSSNERGPVSTAIQEAETAALPTPEEEFGAPWVAVRRALTQNTVYMASRQKGSSVLIARTPVDLGERIRTYAQKKAESRGTAASEEEDAGVFQLVYESRASREMTDEDLRELLREARARNEELNVTGLLLYADGRFMQILEGEEKTVRELYASIREDPRHERVETLLTTPSARRSFPDWTMGIENLEDFSIEEGTTAYLQTGDLPVAAEPMTEVLGALKRFKDSVH